MGAPYKATDGGIDHVLIDEAQDTSPEQWEIIQKLTEEFFAGRGHERDQTRTIFAVGDEKQSIFSFQGADPGQFDINRRYFAEVIAGADQRLHEVPLITSRRSAPEILRFVDRVFEDEAARTGLTVSGATIEHLAHRDTAKGGIEFWPALVPEEEEEIDYYAPVDVVQKEEVPCRPTGGPGRGQNRGLAEKQGSPARPRTRHRAARYHDLAAPP